jgi:hypothetical protein
MNNLREILDSLKRKGGFVIASLNAYAFRLAIYSYGYNVNSLRIEIATTYRSAVGLAMTVRLVVIARSEATKQSLIVFLKKY